jgi:hypothetical protein
MRHVAGHLKAARFAGGPQQLDVLALDVRMRVGRPGPHQDVCFSHHAAAVVAGYFRELQLKF